MLKFVTVKQEGEEEALAIAKGIERLKKVVRHRCANGAHHLHIVYEEGKKATEWPEGIASVRQVEDDEYAELEMYLKHTPIGGRAEEIILR